MFQCFPEASELDGKVVTGADVPLSTGTEISDAGKLELYLHLTDVTTFIGYVATVASV